MYEGSKYKHLRGFINLLTELSNLELNKFILTSHRKLGTP